VEPCDGGGYDAHSYLVCNTYSYTPLQTDTSPSSAAKCLTLGEGRALVRVSASISSVGQ